MALRLVKTTHNNMFAASKSGSVSEPTDSKFNYVTMLLHGNGTNGAQNNTFVDSSTNNFTITRNGNTTQGTFTPYGSNWSNYFSNSYLTTSASAYPSGTGDFTIEGWIFLDNTTANATKTITCGANTNSLGFRVGQSYLGNINGLGLTRYNAADNEYCSYTFSPNTWYHIAVVRSSATIKFYINGTQQTTLGSGIGSYSLASAGTTWIASNTNGDEKFAGSISNLRVTNTAVYTSSFTPSTTPLTAISGTSLLTCQSNRFIDNSTNAFALTTGGSPSVQRFSPFSPTTAYSTSVIGGSGYFDGTSDYLTLGANSAFAFGTGDFTVECWINTSTTTSDTYYRRIYMTDGPTGNVSGNFQIALVPTTGYVNLWDGTLDLIGTSNVCNGAWNHIAATRSGTTLRLFVNGVQQASTTYSVSVSPNSGSPRPYIGTFDGSQGDYNGYITDLRVVKGTAVYTSTFTPPTAPLTAITNTSLLLSYTNAGILDNAMINNLETVGNAQISTSVKKYGTGSMYFDGTGDYLDSTGGIVNALGSGNWTIEFWVYLNSLSATNIIDYRSASVLSNTLGVNYDSGMQLFVNNSTTAIQGSALSTGTWYHVAVCKSGSSTKIFVNGTQAGSTYTDTNNYVAGANRPRIGSGGDVAGNYLNGYIDDLRITKGFARYTANFSVPTAAFPNN